MRTGRGDLGASAVEYALIVAAVAALLLPVAIAFEELLDQVFHNQCVSTAEQNLEPDPEDACD